MPLGAACRVAPCASHRRVWHVTRRICTWRRILWHRRVALHGRHRHVASLHTLRRIATRHVARRLQPIAWTGDDLSTASGTAAAARGSTSSKHAQTHNFHWPFRLSRWVGAVELPTRMRTFPRPAQQERGEGSGDGAGGRAAGAKVRRAGGGEGGRWRGVPSASAPAASRAPGALHVPRFALFSPLNTLQHV